MLNHRLYRDQVILPTQRDPTAQARLEGAARAINAAASDADVATAMRSIDAARIFAIPTEATEAEISFHLDKVAAFLKPGKPPITVVLSALLKSIRTQHGNPNSPALWAEVRQAPDAPADRAPSPPTQTATAHDDGPADDLYAVRRHVAAGDLSAARRGLDRVIGSGRPHPSPLLNETQEMVQTAESAKADAGTQYQSALARKDFPAAERALLSALRIDAGDRRLSDLLDRLPAPPVPGLEAAHESDGIRLHWTPAPGQRDFSYRVLRQNGDAPATSLAEPGLECGMLDRDPPFGRLTYLVQSICGSAPAGMAEVNILHAPQPTGITLTTTETEAVIGWQQPPGASRVLLRLQQPDGSWRSLESSEGSLQGSRGSKVRIRHLQLGQNYRVTLVANYQTVTGQAVTSEPVCVEVVPRGRPTPPAGFSLQPIQLPDGTPGLRASWQPVPGHDVEIWSLPLDSPLDKPLTRQNLQAIGRLIPAEPHRDNGLDVVDIRDSTLPRLFLVVVWDGDRALTAPVRAGACLPTPQQPRQTRLGSEVLISWHWPQDCELVSVWWEYADGRTDTRQLDRHAYHREGGLHIPDPDQNATKARLTAALHEAGQEFHSFPACVEIPVEPPTMTYQLKLPGFPFGQRRAVAEFAGHQHGPVPLVAVLSRGNFLASGPNDGEVVAHFTVDLGTGSNQRVTFPIPRVKGPHSIRLFAAVEGLVHLEDPATDTLRG